MKQSGRWQEQGYSCGSLRLLLVRIGDRQTHPLA